MTTWGGAFIKRSIRDHLTVIEVTALSHERYEKLWDDGMDRAEIMGGDEPYLVKIKFDDTPTHYQFVVWLSGGGDEEALDRIVQHITS